MKYIENKNVSNKKNIILSKVLCNFYLYQKIKNISNKTFNLTKC